MSASPHDQIADGLDYGLATDRSTLYQAFRLQHDQFVAQGYEDAHPSGWRASVYNALSSTRVFVAKSGGRVVGTDTLIADSPLDLPMDEIYPDELQGLRDAGSRLSEVSGLSIDPEYQASGVQIILRVIRLIVLYAAQTTIDLCLTCVNPHHAVFYQRGLNFQKIGGLKQYGKVNGAPAIGLMFDLAIARSAMSELRAGHSPSSELYGFMFHPSTVDTIMARLLKDLSVVIPLKDRVECSFSHHAAWAAASESDRAYILADHKEP